MSNISESFNRWFLPGFVLVSSITLLVIGVPRFLHELMLVPGTPILERLNSGEQVSDEDLTILEESRLSALSFVNLPRAYSDLGSSYLARARQTQDAAKRTEYAQMAIESSMTSLNMAPLNTFAWLRVASANILLGQEHFDDAVTAWRNSIATARFEPFVLLQRVHMGIILYDHMNEEDIALLKDQVDMTYRWNRGLLEKYAKQNGQAEWMVFLSEPDSEMAQVFRK